MIITNLQKLAKNFLRKKALQIAEAGYEAIDIEKVISKRIKLEKNILVIQPCSVFLRRPSKLSPLRLNLNDYKRVFFVGIGKGSALASVSLAKILNRQLTKGIAIDIQLPRGFTRIGTRIYADKRLEILRGTHPLPSAQNIKATKKIIKLTKGLNKDDLLITFICGGGSALLCSSEKELKASRIIFKQLTSVGATIQELNVVRKHLSEVKGGGLAKMAYPANMVSLIVSDVVGNDLSVVASGPTVLDKTTKKDAEKILKQYLNLGTSDVPNINGNNFRTSDVQKLIRALKETPKQKKYFKKACPVPKQSFWCGVKNILFVSNENAIAAMAEKAEKLGLKPKIYSLKLKGEARSAFLPMIKNIKKGEAVLAAGETTVVLRNQELRIRNYGKGGRNMESVLGALNLSPNSCFIIHNSVILSFASDGRDNTEAAGAIGDILTIKKAQELKLNQQEFLNRHDSFNFFKKTGDLMYAKKKSFNMADLMIVLKE